MKTALRLALTVLLAVAFSATALAQWSSTPSLNLALADNNNGSDQVQPKLVPAQNRGWYVSWFDSNPATKPPIGYDVFYQLLSNRGVEQFPHDGQMVADLKTQVRPVTDHSSMYFLSVPLSSRSRVMLSSQILWPLS